MSDLQTTQENQISIISDKINSSLKELINMTKSSITNWESKSVEKAKIALCPTFFSPEITSQVMDNLASFKESIGRMAERANQRMLETDALKELIEVADKYNIPYDKNEVNWLDLVDVIQEYEFLLKQLEEYNLDWDMDYYDPIGLEQTIEDHEHQLREERKDLYRYYLSTRL
jgi:hypothetical protein